MAQASFVGASLGASTLLLSPVAGIIVTKIGYKWTGWVGTLLPIIAMTACYLMDNFLTFQIGLGYGRIVCFACKFCAPKRYFTTKTYDSATRGVFWSNRPKIKANPTTTGVFWSKLCPKIHAY